jgi:hypothetical protein
LIRFEVGALSSAQGGQAILILSPDRFQSGWDDISKDIPLQRGGHSVRRCGRPALLPVYLLNRNRGFYRM